MDRPGLGGDNLAVDAGAGLQLDLVHFHQRVAAHQAGRAQLIEALCDWDQELTDNGLDIAIHRLRRKLQGSGTGVRTIRGLGYLLEEAEAPASDPA